MNQSGSWAELLAEMNKLKAGRTLGFLASEGMTPQNRAEEHPGAYSMKDHLVQPSPSGIGLPSTAGLLGDRNPGQGR